MKQSRPPHGGGSATSGVDVGTNRSSPQGQTEGRTGGPLTDHEVRELGFEPHYGWHLVTPMDGSEQQWWGPGHWDCIDDQVREATKAAAEARYTDPIPFRIPGTEECAVCGEDAEASTVGTPTCSEICTAVLAHQVLSEAADGLYTWADGSGGSPPRYPNPPKPKRRPRVVEGQASVERALERLGDCRNVLERHGHHVRGRMVLCPFHLNERTPAMSLFERKGHSRAHCHSCDWSGDALDLEAALAGEDLKTTITRWS